MRLVVLWGIVLLSVLLCVRAVPASEQRLNRPASAMTPPAALDLDPLLAELVRQRPALGHQLNLSGQVVRNVDHVSEHRLNRNRLLVPPSRQQIADRMEELLRLNADLEESLRRLRSLLVELRERPQAVAAARQLTRDIEVTAGRLQGRFSDYFVESGARSIEIVVPTVSQPQACLVHYLLSAERLQRGLSRQLWRFVQGRDPGRVSVDELGGESIAVLTEAIRELSARTEELLGE